VPTCHFVLCSQQFAIYRTARSPLPRLRLPLSALMIIPHALTFPGAFSPTGRLARFQTTRLSIGFRHLLFPMALTGLRID